MATTTPSTQKVSPESDLISWVFESNLQLSHQKMAKAFDILVFDSIALASKASIMSQPLETSTLVSQSICLKQKLFNCCSLN